MIGIYLPKKFGPSNKEKFMNLESIKSTCGVGIPTNNLSMDTNKEFNKLLEIVVYDRVPSV